MKIALAVIAIILCPFYAQVAAQQDPPPSAARTVEPSSPISTKGRVALPPEKAQPIRITLFNTAPVIDAKLDEEVWKSAAVLKNFYQTQPGDNIAPSHPTEVLVGYDAKNLYLAFRAYDEAGKVRATVANRDDIFDDDTVRVLFDTFNDKRKAYVLAFNAFGIQADGILSDSNGEDYSLDIVMESKGALTENGYVVEVAVPFKSLRYEAGKGKLWGVHFFRRIKRLDDELDSWMPIERGRSGLLNQAGHITGLEGISTERTLEIIPSVTFSETGKRLPTLSEAAISRDPTLTDPGRFLNKPVRVDPGVTVKFGITPTITLDFAANPDFAQVEADQPVVTANQRFPIFFGEKRPFFLEGNDIFQTPIQAVHTRAIIDPDYAVKLTGKQGRNSFGLLLASDNAPGDFSEEETTDPEIFPSIARFVGKNAYIGVLRLKRDVGEESSLGLIATSYNFIEKRNQLAGVDGHFRIDKQTTFTFQALGTTSRRFFDDKELDESVYRTGNAFAYAWNYDKTTRNFGYNVGGQGRTRDYLADVGFVFRTNTNHNHAFIRLSNDPKPDAKFISWRVVNILGTNYDWQGRMQEWGHTVDAVFQFAHNTAIEAEFSYGYDKILEEEFGSRRTAARPGAFFGEDSERSKYRRGFGIGIESEPSDKYSFSFSIGRQLNAFDFDFGAGPRYPRVSRAALIDPDAPLDPGPATEFEVDFEFDYQPTKALSTSFSYSKEKLVRNDTGRVVFDDNIFSSTTTYQFTRFTSFRSRIDYDTLESEVGGQFLLGWTPNPGTSFYVGYNDSLSYNGFSPFTNHLESGFRRHGRTFFIKTSYLLRRSF